MTQIGMIQAFAGFCTYFVIMAENGFLPWCLCHKTSFLGTAALTKYAVVSVPATFFMVANNQLLDIYVLLQSKNLHFAFFLQVFRAGQNIKC
jgi:hypothetical protein